MLDKSSKNFKGFSLIEIMVSIGIMSIVTLGISSMISTQNKQIKVMTEKLSTNELSARLKLTMGSQNYCSCLFRGLTFDETTKTWSSAVNSFPESFTTIPAFPAACTASATMIAAPNMNVSNTSLKIDHVNLTNVLEMPPGSGHYIGDFVFSFKDFIMKPRDVVIPIEFAVDLWTGTSANRSFDSCTISGSNHATLSNCAWEAYGCGMLSCPSGKVLTGIQTQPAFNEDCGGGGNDYDEPSRRVYCCDIN